MEVSTQTKSQTKRKHFIQQTGQEGGWDGEQEVEEVEEVERMNGTRKRGTNDQQRENGQECNKMGKKKKKATQNSETQTPRAKNKTTQAFNWRLIKVDTGNERMGNKEKISTLIQKHRRIQHTPMEMILPSRLSPTKDDRSAPPTTKNEGRDKQREYEMNKRKEYKEKMEKMQEKRNEGKEWEKWTVGEFVWKNMDDGSKPERRQPGEIETIKRVITRISGDERQTQEGEGISKEEGRRVTSGKSKKEDKEHKEEEQKEEQPSTESQRSHISPQSLITLQGKNWVNDEVINTYLTLITNQSKASPEKHVKVHAMSSFFYPRLQAGGYPAVQRWTKKIDLFSFDKILMPLHFGNHWCLISIDTKKKIIGFFDSLHGGDRGSLTTTMNYLTQEARERKNPGFKPEEWAMIIRKKIPRQRNSFDCGVFVCLFAEYEVANRRIDFTPEDMKEQRKRIVRDIVANKLKSLK
ncbi:sentrin-specific protease 2-like [Venturia canescens]|uniref:sentrin-specific protease 2-like n=1 Tax=Venturia canescens TaxID=32260 RepID=UPI001C9CA909|nr:sentrin-specific protease 2-like [Venturia canescens]